MNWICSACADAAGSTWPEGHIATAHEDICGWCGHRARVTAPEDWYPRPVHPRQKEALQALAYSGQDLDAIGRAWAAERRRTGRK